MSPADVTEPAELAAVLGRDPGRHSVTPLLHNVGNQVTGGIWRYTGDGWSAICKLITPGSSAAGHWPTSTQPEHWNYWAREPNAYRCGLPATAYEGTGIAGPALVAAVDRADGVALWLEDVSGTAGDHWTVDQVAAFAQRLGRGQGSYLAGRPLPDLSWLSRRWLRQYVESKPVDGSVLHDNVPWQLPQIAAAYDGLRPGLTRLWDERGQLLQVLEALPQTLCHLDVWPNNLIESGGRHVLLDWAFVGLGAVGEDPGNLVPDCIWDGFLPVEALPELAERVWLAYLAGLREAGWGGDERLARLGFTAGGAVKYAWLAEFSIRRMLTDGGLSSYGGYSQLTPQKVLDTYAGVFAVLLSWAEEARTLAR